MSAEKKDESKESWVTLDKFEMDCGNPGRKTGIPRFPEVQKLIDKYKAIDAKKAKSAKG